VLESLQLVLVWAAAMVTVAVVVEGQGYWETVVANAGISTMHSAVTHYGNVVLLDRTNIGPSQLGLAKGVCRDNPADRVCEFSLISESVILKLAGLGVT